MDPPLNTTFEALKESVEAVKLKQQIQLRNLVFRAKSNNFRNSGRTEGAVNSTSTGRLNNLHKVFNEEIVPKNSFEQLKALHTTETVEDEMDADYTNQSPPLSTRSSIRKSKYSFSEVTPQAKISLLDSYNRDSLEDDDTQFKNSPKISSSVLEEVKLSTNCLTSNQIYMNFIMLIGFLAGLLVSKVLHYIQLYLNWLLQQILQLRNNLMGTISIWEFLNFDDTPIIQVRSKLLLLPIIFLCSLVYSLIYILHFILRFLLTAAPDGLIRFVENLHK